MIQATTMPSRIAARIVAVWLTLERELAVSSFLEGMIFAHYLARWTSRCGAEKLPVFRGAEELENGPLMVRSSRRPNRTGKQKAKPVFDNCLATHSPSDVPPASEPHLARP